MQMNNNKRQDTVLSIIVPVYNVEKYLKTCINSLLEQKLDVYEIILVDDGSTDSSGGICDEYAKKHEKIQVIHKKNGGLSSARNTGIENAVGKYIGFVDSDDYIMPEMYKNLIEVAEKCNAQMVMSRYFCFENQSDLEKISINLKEVKNKARVYNTEDVLKEFFTRNIPESVCSNLYSSELWSKLRFVEGEINEDTNVVYKLLVGSKKTVVMDAQFYGYRKRYGSITNSGYSEKFKVVTEHMSYLENDVKRKHPDVMPYLYHFVGTHYFCLLNSILDSENFELYKSEYELYRKEFKRLVYYFIRWEKFQWKEYVIALLLILPFGEKIRRIFK